MHNLTKIKLFRIALWTTYPIAFIFLYPLALIKKKKESSLFFLFDRFSIGGAQKIFLDILEALSDQEKTVYFTRLSKDGKLKSLFYDQPNTFNKDIHIWCDYILARLFAVHYYAFYLNRHTNLRVLSSNSTFFFDLLPFLKKNSYKIELLHNFSYGKNGFEFFGLANVKFLDQRVIYDDLTLKNIRNQYKEYGIDNNFLDKILFIEPGVVIPEKANKVAAPPIHILYAGRGGKQKRVWLINKIAEYFITRGKAVQFEFAGTMQDELSDLVLQNSNFHGSVETREEMNSIYRNNHLIILTSAFEGFPMVIKEGMANGCIPLVTALEGNKTHLKHLKNAYLIEEIEDEEKIVAAGIQIIESILQEPAQLQKLEQAAYEYAVKNFTKNAFIEKYRKLLL